MALSSSFAREDLTRSRRSGLGSRFVWGREPYRRYEAIYRPDDVVLELGAGTGRHSVALLDAAETVVCLDISPTALAVGHRRTGASSLPASADMEALPIANRPY